MQRRHAALSMSSAARQALVRARLPAAIALFPQVATIDADFEGFRYRLHDYAARWTSGAPRGADDALEARFVPLDEIAALRMWPKTEAVIRDAAALAAREIASRPDAGGTLA